MEHKMILESIPPMKYFIATDISLFDFVCALEDLFGKFNSKFEQVLLFLGRLANMEKVKYVFMFGSAVYRIQQPDDITDIDLMVITDDIIASHLPAKPVERMHLQVKDYDGLVYTYESPSKKPSWEVGMFAGEMLVFKYDDEFDNLLGMIRNAFMENATEYMLNLMFKDMYKIATSQQVRKIYFKRDDPIFDKLKKIKMRIEDISPAEVRIAMKQGGLDGDELYKVAVAALNRRRVKKEYRKELLDKGLKLLA